MSFQDINALRNSPCFIDILTGGISDEFYRSIVANPMNFSEAVDFCESTNGTLARVSTKEEFDIGNSMKSGEVWIGMRREKDSDQVPASFLFIDEVNENISFYEIGNKLPWNPNEPRFGNSFCVQWQAGNINAWDDLTCDSTRIPLCRRSCTSLAPTLSPTKNPTLSPTKSPTLSTRNQTTTIKNVLNRNKFILFSIVGMVLFLSILMHVNLVKKLSKIDKTLENYISML